MSETNRCPEVGKLLQTMPKGGCEETLRIVSEHLSECEACRSLHADLQEMDELLIESKAWFDEVVRRSRIGKPLIITERAALGKRRAWRLRVVWAGAAAILLAITGAAVILLFNKRDRAPIIVRPPVPRTPAVTRAMAAESVSRTLLGVAEVLTRRGAPSLDLPHGQPSLRRESFAPPFLRRCALDSDARLGGIVQSKMDLSTPSVPLRRSLLPRSREQSTLESDATLGKILQSRINLTRREET